MAERALHATTIGPQDSQRWDDFLKSVGGHLLQSYRWGEFKSRFGWRPYRLVLEAGGDILAGAQILVRPSPLGGLAYLPRGPAVVGKEELLSALWPHLHRLAREAGSAFLHLEPDWEEESFEEALRRAGFRPGWMDIQPRTTLVVNLESDREAILARMKPKTRYNIRLAERKGVEVREGNEEDMEAFYGLLRLTGRRDGFAIHSQEYYREAWCAFAPQEMSILLLASYAGQVIAGLMAFAFGKRAYYFYGASSDEYRHLMPNHLLQWEAMRWAKERGCSTYDLWGIPDEVAKGEREEFLHRRGGLWGVYRFKRGFGGEVVRTMGAYDFPYSGVRYFLLTKAASRLWAVFP